MFPRWDARSVDVGAIPADFARAGYHTAVVSDFAGDIFRRIDLGFARVRTPTFDVAELVREVVVGGQGPILPLLRGRMAERALPVLRELHDTTNPNALTEDALEEIDRAGKKPFFVTVFYSTTHFPYAAPAPHWSRFVDPEYRGPFRYGKTPALAAERAPSPADVRAVRGLYDGAVSAVDAAVDRLLAGLAKRGLADDTIVVTSDHGESLYEPGRGQGHGDHLFGDEAVRVPVGHRRPTASRGAAHPGSGARGRSRADPVRAGWRQLRDRRWTLARRRARRASPWLRVWRSPRPVSGSRVTSPTFRRSLRLPYPDLTEVVEVDAGPRR